MRCFIAIDVPNELRERLIKLQRMLLKHCNAKTVEKENLHITMLFLGEIEEKRLKELSEILNNLKKEHPVKVYVRGVGAFPNKNYIRIVWVGCSGLEYLQEKIKKIAKKIGFESKKEGKPHLTLARVKSVHDKASLKKILDNEEIFGEVIVDSVKIKKSTLTKKGPIYEDLHIIKLGG